MCCSRTTRRERLDFHQVEGPAKTLLEAVSSPADQGIAGAALQSGQSQIVDDPQREARCYHAVYSHNDIPTRNPNRRPPRSG